MGLSSPGFRLKSEPHGWCRGGASMDTWGWGSRGLPVPSPLSLSASDEAQLMAADSLKDLLAPD